MATILITGGSGLIGTALTAHLLDRGHVVRHMSRSGGNANGVPTFKWDIGNGTFDDAALDGVDHIVHLAGAGIADSFWTRARVEELIRSRVGSARLLHDHVLALAVPLKSMVSAAGIGYYGAVTSEVAFAETDPPGNDTIATISLEWEMAVNEWQDTCRVVKLRTPVVLARTGGALPKLVKPVRMGLGASFGKGYQRMPWIHIMDLVRIYSKALEDPTMSGAYNVNTAEETTNAGMMRTIAEVLNKPFFLPAVPAFALKLAMGRMASVLLEGSHAKNDRLLATGFEFEYARLRSALEDLL